MIRLTKATIRSYAPNELTFQRGLQLFQNKKVANVTYSANNLTYHMTVRDTYDYQVTICELPNSSFKSHCNCSVHALSANEACKHEIAALFAIYKINEKNSQTAPKTEEERRAAGILDYFEGLNDLALTKEIFHIKPVISLPTMLKNNTGNAFVSICVGNSKMYKVQSLKRFLEEYVNGETISLGKEFEFTQGESAFDSESRQFLSFLLNIYDINNLSSGTDTVFSRAQLQLPKFLFIRMLSLMSELTFDLNLYQKTYTDVRYVKGNPHIDFDLVDFEDSLTIDYADKETIIPITEKGELLYRDGCIYQPDKRFSATFLPFFSNLGGDREPLVFKEDRRKIFLEQILPKIHDSLELTIPAELKERYIEPDFKCEIYLDKYYNYVKAEVIFVYGEYRFNCFSSPATGEYILLRKKDEENRILSLLESYAFEAFNGFYLCKSDSQIYKFLNERVNELSEYAVLFYSDSIKNIFRKHDRNFSISLSQKQDNNLLDMEIQYGDIDKAELKELFLSFKLKKKYYRLKNGDFIDLEDDNISKFLDILEDVNLSYKNISDDATLKVSGSYAIYLAERLNESSFETVRSKEFNDFISNISKDSHEKYLVPSGINAELRPYQVTGFQWLCSLADNHLGGILADDMGLGKTLQAITYIKYMIERDKTLRFMIVCPTSLAYNWQDELENFAPDIPSVVVTGAPPDRERLIKDNIDKSIIITTYPLIRRDIKLYEDIHFHTVFIDEAQFIKNTASISAISVKQLISDHKFALTGTPIENSLSELWSIFDFILPYYLLSHTKFIKQYEKPILKDDQDALNRLNSRIRPFVMRRMKSDVLKDLPDKIETKLLTEMTPEQENVYLAFMESARRDINEEISKNGFEKSRHQIFAILTRLRQICCHPATFIENYEGESGKLNLFLQLLPELIENGHRIVVFSQFTTMLEIIEQKLKEMNISYFYLYGDTKINDRNTMVHDFNNGVGSVMLVSIKTGGTGLNLVGADTVIHFDPWWNPAVEDQATDRAHRIGQTNNVHVIKMLTKNTIEEKIYKMQKRKKSLSDSVILAKEVFLGTLSEEELKELLN